MEIVPEHVASLRRVFEDLSPLSLLTRNLEAMYALYDRLRVEGDVQEVHRDVEKLWAIFDVALNTHNVEFIRRYIDDVCFSPDWIPFSPEAYLHSASLILDWCQKFHAEIGHQILEYHHDALQELPKKCEAVREILHHCLSHQGGDPERRQRRTELIEKLMRTTEGMRLAALAADLCRRRANAHPHNREHLNGLPPDSYLASQHLPPLWLEHYPFQDDAKMMEIVFLSKDELANEHHTLSKLALLGFYMLHSGQVESLEFLSEVFGMEPQRGALWQGLFLVDLCSCDAHFHNEETIELSVQSLREASAQLRTPLPIETLTKLQSLGRGMAAKDMFLTHLQTYLDLMAVPIAMARQGIGFCLSSGDVSAGFVVIRETLRQLHSTEQGIILLRHFYDQILGTGRLEDLVLQELTGMEEAVFIDWAGNKRDDPECSLYLALYCLTQSKITAAQRLYTLNADKKQQSMHKELWNQIGETLKRLPVTLKEGNGALGSVSEEEMSEGSGDEEELEIEEIAYASPALPSHLLHLLKQPFRSGPQLMPTYSETMVSLNICPLKPRTPRPPPIDLLPTRPSPKPIESETESEIFYDAVETLEA